MIYRGYLEKDPMKLVAVKILTLKEAQHVYDFVDFQLNILSKIDGPHVVKILHKARIANLVYIFLDFYKVGDLQTFIRQTQSISEIAALSYIRQILSGYMSIYQRYIIHGNLKPANILICEGQLKIADFGLARVVERVKTQYSLGTILYKIRNFGDIWSLGIIFYELLYGHTPCLGGTQQELFDNIQNITLQFSEKVSRKTNQLIRKMLEFQIEDRITWNQLFSDDLMNESITPIEFQNLVNSQDPGEQNTKIDILLRKIRNVGIFINTTTNMIYKLGNQQKMKLAEHLYLRIIFVLLKYQMIIFEDLIDIMNDKRPLREGFNQNDWNNYKLSPEYQQFLTIISDDKTKLQPYFDQVQQLTTQHLHKIIQNPYPQQQTFLEFQQILNSNFSQNQQFKDIYSKTIIEFLQASEILSDHDILQALKYLVICQDPYTYFHNQGYDFHKFYEYYDNMLNDKLLDEVTQDLKCI